MTVQVLGEDRIRVFIAQVDAKTLVVTVGGSMPFMQEAIQAARKSTRVVPRRTQVEMAAYLPKKPTALMIFSLGNLRDVVFTAAQRIQPMFANMVPQFNDKEPVVIGSGFTGKAVHVVFFVPSSTIKETVKVVQQMQGMFGGSGPGGPPAPGGDF